MLLSWRAEFFPFSFELKRSELWMMAFTRFLTFFSPSLEGGDVRSSTIHLVLS